MSNELVEMTAEEQLDVQVEKHGLSPSRAKEIRDSFDFAFDLADRWETMAKELLVTNESMVGTMEAARELRLEIRERRIAIEKKRVELKADALSTGKYIDGIANVLKGIITPIEKFLDTQERYVQIKEEAAAEERRKKAEALLAEQEEADRLKKIDDDNRERARLKNEAKVNKEKADAAEAARVEAEEKAEAERQKRIKADKSAKKARAEVRTIKAEAPLFTAPAPVNRVSEYVAEHPPGATPDKLLRKCPSCGAVHPDEHFEFVK